mmetsp:Transcript_103590/g.278316  ORF Transcript_103590/g.278316 Transcript_103590/m.278316 type:complete len:258 (-) Transcript_103590:293-1066(-)
MVGGRILDEAILGFMNKLHEALERLEELLQLLLAEPHRLARERVHLLAAALRLLLTTEVVPRSSIATASSFGTTASNQHTSCSTTTPSEGAAIATNLICPDLHVAASDIYFQAVTLALVARADCMRRGRELDEAVLAIVLQSDEAGHLQIVGLEVVAGLPGRDLTREGVDATTTATATTAVVIPVATAVSPIAVATTSTTTVAATVFPATIRIALFVALLSAVVTALWCWRPCISCSEGGINLREREVGCCSAISRS